MVAKKFALPNLQEGCIIEYKYTEKAKSITFLPYWYFQSDIPTRFSEFRTSIPEWYTYLSFNQRLVPNVETTEAIETLKIPHTKYKGRSGNSNLPQTYMSGGSTKVNHIKNRYFLENIPALKRERFVTTMKDYYSRLSLQLKSISYSNGPLYNVIKTWLELAKDLEERKNFGDQINKKRNTKKIMEALAPQLKGIDNDLEKVEMIYTFLSEEIEWNDRYSIYSSSLNKNFEKKRASAGQMNLMLIALCRQLKISAYPVLISTRSHGKSMNYYPKLDQFNHVLAVVVDKNQQFFYDVGDTNREPGLLRWNSLNYSGWFLDGDQSRWIDLPLPTNKNVSFIAATLNEKGDLTAEVKRSLTGYDAVNERKIYKKEEGANRQHIKNKWQKKFPDAVFKNFVFENEDDAKKPLKYEVELDIPQAAQVAGDFIYLSPMLGLGYEENPLKLEERTFPVDMTVKKKENYILNVTIPDGYVVEELPNTIKMKTEDDGGSFQYLVSQDGNKIQIISKVSITKLQYEPEEYSTIKGFFDLIVENTVSKLF